MWWRSKSACCAVNAWTAASPHQSGWCQRSPPGSGSATPPGPRSNGCSQPKKHAPKWAAPTPSQPASKRTRRKSHNPCATVLVAIAIVASAGVNPLPAGWCPDLLPAIVPVVRYVVVVVRYVVVKECSVNKMPASEWRADKAGSAADENLPTHSHAAHSASETAPLERQGRRHRDNCRPNRGCGEPTEEFTHHFDPSRKLATQARYARHCN